MVSAHSGLIDVSTDDNFIGCLTHQNVNDVFTPCA